jgi:aspartate racemase
MKTIGLVGGMSWESTVEYYRMINRDVRDRLGPLHSARIVLASVDFAEVEALQEAGRWAEAGRLLAAEARKVEGAGADLLLLCTNTMHKVADAVQAAVSIPLLHIADAAAARVRAAGLLTVGLLATRFTMEEDFYRGRLAERHGLSVIVPGAADRALVHRVIYEELCAGAIEAASKAEYLRVIDTLIGEGAQGIVLGCTEVGLLIKPEDVAVPVFDSTEIHARAAVDAAL